MMLLPCTILSLIIVSNSFAASDSAGRTKNINTSNPVVGPEFKIRHLHLLFRHGDRSPIVERIVHGDAAKRMWPQGYGQLTDIGILQEFRLGQWIRSNYGEFIPSEYNASLYHMRSTDLDRTLMSAQCVSAGVFLDSSSPLKPYGIQWRPVPVHTVPQTEDILLSTADCPCLSVLQDVEMNSEKSVQFEHDHSKLFELLSNKTGTHVNRHNLWEYSDTLTCMRAHNYTMPEWYTEQLYQEMQEVESFYWAQKYTSTSLIVRLEIGVFLSLLRDHLLAIVSGSHFILNRRHHLAVQHLMAYSAHDTDVCYLLAAFGAYYEHIIPYSAAIVIELLGPKPPAPASEYRLRLVYKRGYLDSEGHYVQFGACTNEPAVRGCPLEDVLAFLSPLFLEPDNFDAECQVETRRNIPYPLLFSRSATPFSCTSHGKTKWYIVCISATCATLAILGVVALLLSIHSLRRRRRRHLQHSLNNTLDYASCKT